jgi:PIN domain nuclease of toxin-antitoxin system
MIYLDTHVVVWLYAGDKNKLTKKGIKLINENELLISPIIQLELQYLLEIKRITEPAVILLKDLSKRIGLKTCQKPFEKIIKESIKQNWTRDPFDRIIVAQAMFDNTLLLTKDKTILAHYKNSCW